MVGKTRWLRPGSPLMTPRPLRVQQQLARRQCFVAAHGFIAPLPHIAMHLAQAPGVGRQQLHRLRPLKVAADIAAVGRGVAVVVHLARRDVVAQVERPGGAGGAGVFPLRLGGQAGAGQLSAQRDQAHTKTVGAVNRATRHYQW